LEVTEEKIKEIKRRRDWSHQQFLKHQLGSYKYIAEREKGIFSNGHVPGKVKDFIALGIAIIGNCESCIQFHIEEALRKGATGDEILEIIDLTIFEGGSIAIIPARFALEVLDYIQKRKRKKPKKPD